jgi:hypothetical protein
MADFSITLTIPEYLYDRARRLAEQQALPIEQVLVHQLETTFVEIPALPPDEQAELEALKFLSDQALWTIAREQMPEPDQERMQSLMERNNLGTISAQDRDALVLLVDQGQRLILRKAKAMALLTERGHSIDPETLAHG